MNVQQIYEKYLIPPNLQKHMLRVAALSSIVAENWNETGLDKNSVILACVFHDMANIIKFNFNKPSLFKEEENQADYWKKVQEEMISRYGNDVHLATFTIGQEIGLPEPILRIIKNLNWQQTLQLLENEDYASAIPIYCDMRIGPYGIKSLKDRIDNVATRNNKFNMDFIKKSAETLESTLQNHVLINLSEINNSELNTKFDELLQLTVTT